MLFSRTFENHKVLEQVQSLRWSSPYNFGLKTLKRRTKNVLIADRELERGGYRVKAAAFVKIEYDVHVLNGLPCGACDDQFGLKKWRITRITRITRLKPAAGGSPV